MEVEFSIPVSLQDVETQFEYNEEELSNGDLIEGSLVDLLVPYSFIDLAIIKVLHDFDIVSPHCVECRDCLTAEKSFSIESCFSMYIHVLR